MSILLAVLIVEDSESDAQLLVRSLKKADYDLVYEQVETENQMRSALEKRAWNIIISDYKMPSFDGLAALKLLQEMGWDIPFIVVSGTIGEETAVEMMKAGAHDYLIKGDLARLIPAVERELGQAEVRRERKRAENALQESESRYRTLVESSPDTIGIHCEGKVAYVNPAAVKLFRAKSQEDLIGLPVIQLVHPDYRAIVLERMRRSYENSQPASLMEEKFITLDGQMIDVEVTSTPITFNGKPATQIIIRDITERKQAEESLRTSEERYRELFNSMIEGFALHEIICDENGKPVDYRFIEVNPAFERLTGLQSENLIGHTVLEVMPNTESYWIDIYGNVALSGRSTFFENYSGELDRYFEVSAYCPRPGQFAVIMMDITDRKNAEDNIHQRVVELETLNRVSIALRAVSNQDELLAVVLEEALYALGAEHGSINLANDDGDLQKTTARGWLSDLKETVTKSGEGIFGKVFASRKAYISRDFSADSLTNEEMRGQLPSGWGGVCVPICSTKQTLGVLLVAVPSQRELNLDEVRMLNTLAEMAGAALYRMRLFNETARRAEEFAALYETSNALSAESDLNTLLQTIVEHAVSLLKASSSGMYLFDAEREELEVVVDTSPYHSTGTRLHLGEGIAGRVAQSRLPLRIENYSTWEGRSPKYEAVPFRAILEVPMLYRGELIGVLTADETGASDRKFTETDERLLSLFASQAAGVIHSARLFEKITRNLEHLQSLHKIDRAISSSFDLRPILSAVINHTLTQLGVDAADILLFHPDLQTLEYAAGRGFRTHGVKSISIRLGEDYAGRVALERRVLNVTNSTPMAGRSSFANMWAGEGFESYFGVPLIAKGEVKGVLEVFNRTPLPSGPEWLEFLETLAGQTAIAIDNTQLFDNLQKVNLEIAIAYDATIEGWSRAMELRDENTEGHTQRVTDLTVTFAKIMGVKDKEILHIRRGALLHDIGKIGVPDHILLKKDKLTKKEWEIMRRHPQFAYEMLKPIYYLRQSLDIPYCHHEKWDGTGYPRGLKGGQIPLAARIFAIADVYDAVTNNRPYRKAWTKAKTLKYIREQGGSHFDPQLAEKFLEMFGNV